MIAAHHANQRLAVLVDADNAEILDGKRQKLRLRELLKRMNGRQLTRAIYFRPEKHFYEGAQQFIQSAGYEVRTTAKNSDAWVAAEAFSLSEKCDVIAFVGGDRDLEPTINLLRANGVRVEVWAWPHKVSECVRELADFFVPLTSDLLVPSRSGDRGNGKPQCTEPHRSTCDVPSE